MTTRADRRSPKGLATAAVCVGLLLILPLFFLDLEALAGRRMPPEFSTAAHVVFFAALTATLLVWRPRAAGVRYIAAVVIGLVLFGVLIEGLQSISGREASLRDILLNSVGIVVGLCIALPSRRLLVPLVAIPTLIATLGLPAIDLWDRWQATRQFPVISDFEGRFEHRRWSSGERVLHEPTNDYVLHVPLPPGRYPGTSLRRSFGNWQDHECLVLDLYNPESRNLHLTLSIRDEEHEARGANFNDRFNRRISLPPGPSTLGILTKTIADAPATRTLDLNAITEVVLFTSNPTETRHLIVARVFLSSGTNKYDCS